MKIIIGVETEDDIEPITRLHITAFNGDSEAKLVEKLRKTPKYVPNLSLVAKYKKRIIGHILFYPIEIQTKRNKVDSLALAPISVLPSFQHKGVGGRLIKEGLEAAQKLGFKSAIVIGHSEYYPKFGFRKASEYGIVAPFDVPDINFFAIELAKNGLKNCSGTVEYPREFNEV